MASTVTASNFLPCPSGPIYYEQEGDRSGPSLLFIHGLGGSTNTYQPLMPYLQDCNIVRLDISGMGRSFVPDRKPTMQSYADDCEAVTTHLNLQNVTVIAHSFSGIIALLLAIKSPQLIKNLILFSPTKPPTPTYRDTLYARAAFVRSGGMAVMADVVVGACSPASLRSNVLLAGYVRELVSRQQVEGYALACEAYAEATDLAWDAVKAEQVVVVAGADDKLATPDVCSNIAEKVKSAAGKAELMMWENIGHWPTLEDPEACVKIVKGVVG